VTRVGPQVAPPLGEHAGAHRLPRLEVRQDPEKDLVPEAAEAVAASGRPRAAASSGAISSNGLAAQNTATHLSHKQEARIKNSVCTLHFCSVRKEPRKANGLWHSVGMDSHTSRKDEGTGQQSRQGKGREGSAIEAREGKGREE
jgi:hypothetical protein